MLTKRDGVREKMWSGEVSWSSQGKAAEREVRALKGPATRLRTRLVKVILKQRVKRVSLLLCVYVLIIFHLLW